MGSRNGIPANLPFLRYVLHVQGTTVPKATLPCRQVLYLFICKPLKNLTVSAPLWLPRFVVPFERSSFSTEPKLLPNISLTLLYHSSFSHSGEEESVGNMYVVSCFAYSVIDHVRPPGSNTWKRGHGVGYNLKRHLSGNT